MTRLRAHDRRTGDGHTHARRAAHTTAVRAHVSPTHLGVATVGELIAPSLWYRDRATRVSELLAQADTEDRASVLDAIQRIGEHEAVRRFLEPLLDLPVALEREARSLLPGVTPSIHAACLGVPLALDGAGYLTLAGLDALAPTPFAALLAEELVAAAQLLEIEGAVRRVDELAALPQALDDLAAQPSKYPLATAVALRDAAHGAWRRAAHLCAVLVASNEDQRLRLEGASAQAYAWFGQARTAHHAAQAYFDARLGELTWAPGEAYFEHEEDDLARGGVTGYLDWAATKAFHLAGNTVTAGSLDRLARNNRAYRAGVISWDAYQHNEAISWVAGAAEVVATALAGRAGGRLAAFGLGQLGVREVSAELSAQLATQLTARTAVQTTTGLVAGSLVGAAAPVTNDAVALVGAYLSDDPHIQAYQRSMIGGPESWGQGAVAGALLGGVGGALSARSPTAPAYDWKGFDPDGWARAAVDDPAPVFDTLPPAIVERLAPARAALARRDVSSALRIVDEVALSDRLPAPLVARIERDLAAELTGDQAITPLSAYRTPRALLPDGRWVDPTDRMTKRYYGLSVSDAEAHRLMLEGLPARGPNLHLLDHALERGGTAFRGTTVQVLTPGSAGEQQGAGAWADAGGWVFEIEGVPSWHIEGVLEGRVPTVGGYTGALTRAELEHAILAHVPSERIVSIRKMYEHNGRLGFRDPIPNPNYRGSR